GAGADHAAQLVLLLREARNLHGGLLLVALDRLVPFADRLAQIRDAAVQVAYRRFDRRSPGAVVGVLRGDVLLTRALLDGDLLLEVVAVGYDFLALVVVSVSLRDGGVIGSLGSVDDVGQRLHRLGNTERQRELLELRLHTLRRGAVGRDREVGRGDAGFLRVD